jgi:hypothetical protein
MNRMEYKIRAYELAKRGTQLEQAKLDEKTVRMIRKDHARKLKIIKLLNAKYSAKALAKRFRVHHRTIEKILTWETWTHVR